MKKDYIVNKMFYNDEVLLRYFNSVLLLGFTVFVNQEERQCRIWGIMINFLPDTNGKVLKINQKQQKLTIYWNNTS